MSQDSGVTVAVEQGNGGIDPGDTVNGIITSTSIRKWDGPDGAVTYYDITVEEEQSGIEFNPSYAISGAGDDSLRVTPTTQMGATLERMGVDLSVGADINLDEVFSPGTMVTFEVAAEDAPEDDDRDYYLRCDKETLRAQGEDSPQPVEVEANDDDSGSESGGQSDNHARVLTFIEENDLEGEPRNDVMMELTQEDGELVKAFKQLESTPKINTEGDVVVLG